MSIRNRIFLVFVLAAGLAGYALVDWMSSEMRPRYMEAQEDLMVDLGHVLANQIQAVALHDDRGRMRPDPLQLQRQFAGLGETRFAAQIYGLLKSRVDVRVYVTDAAGLVLFDSDNNRDLGRNNGEWRDIRLSLSGEYGARSTDGDPMFPQGATMYVSTPIRHQGEIVGVVSVGKPTRNAERFRASAVARFSQAAIAALALGLIVALVLYWWVSRPMQQLHRYAEALRAGERVPPPALGNNEIGRVGEAMTALRDALDGKQYVEQYVQALTHELKSPTAAIAGAAELLSEDVPEEQRQRFLSNIRNETGRLQSLVERMLELAEIENRPALESPRLIAVDELLDEVVDSLAPQIHQRQIVIAQTVAAKLTVRGEHFLLLRALSNLLSNALEFSPVGSTIGITATQQAGKLSLCIRDSGPGIPDYAAGRVFERFYSLPRADGSKGTGLGLSFVAQIAALHQGRIQLGQHPQGGTLAELILPAC